MSEIKPGKRYFSVVYEIVEPDAFQPCASVISEHMHKELVENGCKVTACGWGDYATERDALAYELLNTFGVDSDSAVENFIREEEVNILTQDITG